MIYFTADTHFCHSNIINLQNRPFKNLNEMNKALIQNWNTYILPRDDIYILGDFIHKGTESEVKEIIRKLHGKKYLIKGNHDDFLNDPNFDTNVFEWIKDYFVLNYKKQKFILFHYPILEWQGFFNDTIHLYGHVHSTNKNPLQTNRLNILGNRAINVGVDVNNFFPLSIEDIIKKDTINYEEH